MVKVIFLKDVESVGSLGDEKNVTGGYARNYLIPRGLAVVATLNNLKGMAEQLSKARAEQKSDQQDSLKLASKLSKTRLIFRMRTGAEGVFGAITTKDIAESLRENEKVDIDKHMVELENPLNQLGEHKVVIHVAPEVKATISVTLTDEAQSK